MGEQAVATHQQLLVAPFKIHTNDLWEVTEQLRERSAGHTNRHSPLISRLTRDDQVAAATRSLKAIMGYSRSCSLVWATAHR
jgi:hypothetical protein